ncbi:hypothetical protein MIDIC_70029 [Alphaproteobacteria bacterium]
MGIDRFNRHKSAPHAAGARTRARKSYMQHVMNLNSIRFFITAGQRSDYVKALDLIEER